MIGQVLTINGDAWTVVDVAPAEPLAEMVAVILEEENFTVLVRGADFLADVFSHLGAMSAQTTFVLVPTDEAERALALIAETVTDYEGEDLEELMDLMEAGELPEDLLGSLDEEDDEDYEEDDGATDAG